MNLYEFSDFIENPTLITDKEACDSIMSQLMIAVSRKSKALYHLLFLSHKHSTEIGHRAPSSVYVNKDGYHWNLNLSYILEGFTFDDYVTISIHEALHLLYMHPLMYREKVTRDLNIALDTVINQDDLVDDKVIDRTGAISLKVFTDIVRRRGYQGTVLPQQNHTYYLNILNQYPDESQQQNQSGSGSSDNKSDEQSDSGAEAQTHESHEQWKRGNGDADSEEQLKAIARQLKQLPITEQELKELVNKMTESNKEAGHLTSLLVELVEKGAIFKLPTLKSVVSKALTIDPERRRTIRAIRPNDGSNVIKKGRKTRKNSANLVYFYGDTSGSINFDDVKSIVTTLECQRDKCDAKLYLFSDRVYDYSTKHVEVGGTNLQAVFDHLVDNNVNPRTKVVLFTDGYVDRFNTRGYNNVLWVLTEDGTTNCIPDLHRHVKISH